MKNKLKLNLIWSAEHLTTNYHTINYWHEHGTYGTFLSNEITKKEIEEISEKTNSKLFVQLFGFIPMYVSRRHAIKNYLKYFGLKREDKEYYLFKEDKTYSIVDNNEGTMIFSNFILNGLKESIALSKSIDYILINGYHLKDDELSKVINYFKIANLDNINSLERELEQIFTNLGKGFLYEETIYKVKKDA